MGMDPGALGVVDYTGSGYTPGLWIQAGDTGAIAASQHEVWPAVCDGLLVLGASSATGTGGDGWLNTRLSSGASFGSGWFQLPWGAYNGAVGSTYPSCGDIDGDGKQEIAVGLGSYTASGGYVGLVEDRHTGGFIGWPRVHWGAYNSAVGSTWPALPR